jgi:general secretion pathway protein G
MTKTPSLLRLRSKSKARGFSLTEVLVALAIVTLATVAVGIGAFKIFVDGKDKDARNEARSVRHAVKTRQLDHEGCPTFQTLLDDGVLDEDSPKQDPWGNAWRIRCDGARVTVETDGPDHQRGTADDVRVPEAQGAEESAVTGG